MIYREYFECLMGLFDAYGTHRLHLLKVEGIQHRDVPCPLCPCLPGEVGKGVDPGFVRLEGAVNKKVVVHGYGCCTVPHEADDP